MKEQDVLKELKRRIPEILPEARIRWLERPAASENAQVDALAELRLAGHRSRLLLELLSQPNPARVRQYGERAKALARSLGHAIPVLVSPHLNEPLRRQCIEAGVHYIDLSGNVRLQDGPLVIQKEVSKNRYPHQSRERGLFADKASLVLRYLIDRRSPAGVREIAGAVRLDPGYVSRLVRVAVEHGYASSERGGRVRLRNIPDLLEDWSANYSWRRNRCQWFLWIGQSVRSRQRLLDHIRLWPKESYALSLHGGNNLVDPFADYDVWHLYGGQDVARRIAALPGAKPAPADAGNIVLMEPHYARSSFFGARIVRGIRVVSDLQLYLDLRRFPVRGREAADEILQRRLRKLWEKP